MITLEKNQDRKNQDRGRRAQPLRHLAGAAAWHRAGPVHDAARLLPDHVAFVGGVPAEREPISP